MKQAVNLTLWSIVVVICTAWLTSSNCILPTIFMLGWFPKSKLLFCGSDTALTISSTPTLETTYVSKLYSSPSCQDSSKCSNGVDFITEVHEALWPSTNEQVFSMKIHSNERISILQHCAKFCAWCVPLIFLSWFKLNCKYLFQFEVHVHTLSTSIPST